MKTYTRTVGGTTVTITDATDDVIKAMESAIERGLEACGMQAENYAKKNITNAHRIDTGRLRNSITHYSVRRPNGRDEYIGTAVEYAPYIEYGTGIYASNGMGKQEPWVYKDEKGKWHWTRGIEPIHFLQRAAQNHKRKYQSIIKDSLENA